MVQLVRVERLLDTIILFCFFGHILFRFLSENKKTFLTSRRRPAVKGSPSVTLYRRFNYRCLFNCFTIIHYLIIITRPCFAHQLFYFHHNFFPVGTGLSHVVTYLSLSFIVLLCLKKDTVPSGKR